MSNIKTLKQQEKLLKREDKYGNKWGLKRWPMNDAYCSYLDCENKEILKIAFPGQKCPKCGRPLSWSGVKKERVNGEAKYTYLEPRGKWKP